MKRIITSIIGTTTLLASFAVSVYTLVAADEAPKYKSEIESCIEKRKSGSERSETEFVCPTGDFFILPDGRTFAMNDANVAYQVVISKSFNDLDKEVKEYLKKLQENRNKNPASWTEDIRMAFEKNYNDKYLAICTTTAREEVLKWIQTREEGSKSVSTDLVMIVAGITDMYPSCKLLVQDKITAFRQVSTMLAAQGVTKSFTNDKSEFIEKVKTKYDGVLETWRNYVAALTKATDKWNAFIKTPSIAP